MTDAIMCRIRSFGGQRADENSMSGPLFSFEANPRLQKKSGDESGATIGIDIDDLEGMIDRAVRSGVLKTTDIILFNKC